MLESLPEAFKRHTTGDVEFFEKLWGGDWRGPLHVPMVQLVDEVTRLTRHRRGARTPMSNVGNHDI